MVLPIDSKQTVKSEKNETEKSKTRINKIDYGEDFKPPDGGWGWVVCIANGLTNICTVPMVQQFGFIFQDHLKVNDITNFQIATITNTYQAMAALTEFLIVPLFRRYTYRQIALLGSLIIVLGIFLTIYAYTFLTFLIIYSLIFAFGRGVNLAAKNIAFNVYFKENRKRGTSLIVVITAIGPLFMSYLSLALLEKFGLQGTILFMTCFAMLSLPLSWVYKPIPIQKKNEESIENNITTSSDQTNHYEVNVIRIDQNISKDVEIVTKNASNEKKVESDGFYKKIVKCFDLALLKDLRYCNIIVGLTLAQYVESNVNILTPFILSDYGYSYSDIALIMTVSRIPDILSRFLSPFIVEYFDWDNRVFWLIALAFMATSEIVISYNPPFPVMFGCFIVLGIFRGLRMIFNTIIIPGYVPLKKLPAASGLHKMVSGFFMLAFGPVIGLIRDAGTDYTMALTFLNCLSILTILTWVIDLIIEHRMNLKKQNKFELPEKNSVCDDFSKNNVIITKM